MFETMQRNDNVIPRECYFAASNSGYGFKSYFEELFFNQEITRRYIIKGGPGTGKSTLMRGIGERAEREGRRVEYYYCSSDTGSLDGVIIDSATAIFDGTSPHSYDTVLPGAIDDIIDLGRFWNSEALSEKKEQISRLSSLKKKSYARAYRYLSAAFDILRALGSLASPYIDGYKLQAAVGRMCEKIPSGNSGELIPLAVSAIGVHGRVRFDTLEARATELYALCDSYGIAKRYLGLLTSELLKRGCRLRVAYDPIDPESVETVFDEGSGACFYVCEDADALPPNAQRINMKRFLALDKLSEIRGEYRSAEKQYAALISLAEQALNESGRAHAELEKIYSANMDFDSLNAFSENFLQKNK